jgi:hypothetical protein
LFLASFSLHFHVAVAVSNDSADYLKFRNTLNISTN